MWLRRSGYACFPSKSSVGLASRIPPVIPIRVLHAVVPSVELNSDPDLPGFVSPFSLRCRRLPSACTSISGASPGDSHVPFFRGIQRSGCLAAWEPGGLTFPATPGASAGSRASCLPLHWATSPPSASSGLILLCLNIYMFSTDLF